MQGSNRTPVNSPSQRFKQTLMELFESLSDVVADIYSAGLCHITDKGVEMTAILVSAYPSQDLMESFISSHKHWVHIENRNTKYIMHDLDQMLLKNQITMDTSSIKVPFSAYDKLRGDTQKYGTDSSDWPVNEDDLNSIWSYFDSLIGIACNHVHGCIKKRESYPDYYREIDVEGYSKRLKFTLRDNTN